MALSNGGKMTDLSAQAEAWTQPVPLNIDPTTQGQFGPGRPVLPVWPEDKPRLFQYPPGINLVSIPRAGFGLVSFPILRNLAVACKEVRLNIELIKREVRALEWDIVPRIEGDKTDYGPAIARLKGWWESPDGVQDFDQWLNVVLEELLVIDAPALWPEVNRSGDLLALEPIAGDTLRPLLDLRGRIAPPPMPAYVQIIHGLPRSYFTRDRLIYRPFNSSATSPYGTSPIEFFILVVNLALRRDVFHIGYFTEGNVPEALVGMPPDWTQTQIDTWQKYWDSMIAGNMTEQRKIHFMPAGGGSGGSQIPVYEFRKDDPNEVSRDEWLMRVACWAFGNSPAEFGITAGTGLGGSGFAASMENVQYRSILGPITQYLQKRFSAIIHRWHREPNLKWIWLGMEPQEDELRQAQVDEIYLRRGVYGIDDVRTRIGMEPIGIPPMIDTPTGPIEVKPGMILSRPASPFEGLGFGVPGVSEEETPARKFFHQQGNWSDYG